MTAWTPPGPGTWELDTAHFEPNVSRPMRDLMEAAAKRGFREGFEIAGAPLKGVQTTMVNGRFYRRLVPLVGGWRDLPTPPLPVLRLIVRFHPAFRRRAKQSERAMGARFWLQEFERWEREWKPRIIATNRRLGDVDVGELSDEALAKHLGKVWDHCLWAGALHFRLHTSDLAPIGLLLVSATDWGLDHAAVMRTLTGSSPATSAPARAIAALADELDAAGVDRAALRSFSAIRRASERASALLDDYLGEFGNRVSTGYDIRDRTLAELPDVVVSSVRQSDVADFDQIAADADAVLNELAAQLDEADQPEFRRLVDEARTLYGLRDENGPLTVEWPAGVLRHAVVESGRRLVDAGKITEAEHVFDASIDELRGMLGGGGPAAGELAERCAERMSWVGLEPPAVLGREPESPDVSMLPETMATMMRAVLTVSTLLDAGDLTGAGHAVLSGVGVGDQPVRGVARVVAGADDALDRAEPGDIIVARFTVPTFNAVLAMAGGVVTEGGGLLSHTAVIARELGIPAVIGVPGALSRIPDGAVIDVDPVAGNVTVVSDFN